MPFFRKTVFLMMIFFLCLSKVRSAERPWGICVYGGQWSNNRIGEILSFQTNFEKSYVWAASVSRKVMSLSDFLDVEVEFNSAFHSGLQSHMEINAACVLRWQKFPWNHLVKTSLAYGLGPSVAFQRPPIEDRERRGPTFCLVFMPVELTFGMPETCRSPWEIFLRIHHRSGAYGVVSDSGGSNFITAGVRYRF